MKHLLSFLVLMCVSLSAMASETSVKNAEGVDIWYTFNSSTKTASVTYRGYFYFSYDNEYTGEVVIPSTVTYEGVEYSVTSIGNYAFGNCDALTSVTLPESLTSIGYDAFSNCDALTSIDVASNNANYTSVDGVLFNKDMTTLIQYPAGKDATSYTIPEGVTSIGNYAFADCYSLTSITLPEGVTEIGDHAFYFCDALTSITIPEGVTSIEDYAFYFCNALTSITIPEGVTSIGKSAFEFCSALTSITLPESLTSIGDNAFYYCVSLTSITLPESLTSIGDNAFEECYSLTSITLPENLTTIGENAFIDCSALTKVNYNGTIADWCGISFGNAYSNPMYCTGHYSFDGVEVTDVVISSGVTTINNYAFYYCDGLTSITLPEGVTSIGNDAFAYCYSLTSITLPKGLTSIGSFAFYECDALTSITLPESLTSIGNFAFEDCWSLTSITSKNAIPPTIGGSYTFYDVDKFIPVYVPKSSIDAYKSAEYWKDFTNFIGGAYFVDVIAENGTVEGAGAYEENAEVTLTATPAKGYKFVQWSDGVTDNPRTVIVTADMMLTAEFEIDDTPISDIQTSDVNVRLIGNNIVVEGADDYTVYSVSGQNLGKVESVERGIYIVVVNGKSFKVVAK